MYLVCVHVQRNVAFLVATGSTFSMELSFCCSASSCAWWEQVRLSCDCRVIVM